MAKKIDIPKEVIEKLFNFKKWDMIDKCGTAEPNMKNNSSHKFNREYGNVMDDGLTTLNNNFAYEELKRAMKTGIGRAERFRPENGEIIEDAIFEEVK